MARDVNAERYENDPRLIEELRKLLNAVESGNIFVRNTSMSISQSQPAFGASIREITLTIDYFERSK